MKIPRSHPRYDSLVRRERLVRAWKEGVAVPEGLIAHGRGEAWDYLFQEETRASALVAESAAVVHLLAAGRTLISLNGTKVRRALARSSQRATIPIVDELTSEILNNKKVVEELKADPAEVGRIRRAYRRNGNLGAVFSFLECRHTDIRRSLFRGGKRPRSQKR